MINRNLVTLTFLACLATTTTVLSMDRDARMILSAGGGYTSIEESDIAGFGAGAMLAIDREGAFAIDFSGDYLKDSGDAKEKGYQLAFGVNWFPSDKLKLRLGGFYSSTEWSSFATVIDAERRTLYSSWDSEGESSGVEFNIKYRLIPASEDFSPYLFAGLGVSKPDIEAKNTGTFAIAPSGYIFRNTRTRYMDFGYAPVEYDLSNVFSATLGVGIDLALTRNIGLNLYGKVGVSQYDHTVIVWDQEFNQSDSTYWGLGASIKWYWGNSKDTSALESL